jgi:N6-L-threonylcarbamoyladenine synthase
MNTYFTYLSIETSCDETSLALLQIPKDKIESGVEFLDRIRSIKVLAHIISSQIDIHKEYGGVIPEIGARLHANAIHFLLDQLISQQDDKEILDKIDKIFVTATPGLPSALRVGIEFAKSLKFYLQQKNPSQSSLEVVHINHLHGHVASCFFA